MTRLQSVLFFPPLQVPVVIKKKKKESPFTGGIAETSSSVNFQKDTTSNTKPHDPVLKSPSTGIGVYLSVKVQETRVEVIPVLWSVFKNWQTFQRRMAPL